MFWVRSQSTILLNKNHSSTWVYPNLYLLVLHHSNVLHLIFSPNHISKTSNFQFLKSCAMPKSLPIFSSHPFILLPLHNLKNHQHIHLLTTLQIQLLSDIPNYILCNLGYSHPLFLSIHFFDHTAISIMSLLIPNFKILPKI